jgi:hypothetical protein
VVRQLAAAVAFVAAAAVSFPACSGRAAGPLALTLASPTSVVVSGLSSEETSALARAGLSDDQMQRVLRVRVEGAETAVAGKYVISNGRIEFTPAFPFDAGRRYVLELRWDEMPVRRQAGSTSETAALPGSAVTPATRIVRVTPTAAAWPANLLRVYLHFSGPMSRDSGVGQVVLRDDGGVEVTEAFLPLEADFWSPDHTRYTVFLDPGRVKRGILPNRQRGRALVSGRRYVLEVSSAWRDAHGRPLAGPFRHEFVAGPAIEKAMRVEDWQLGGVAGGTREPLVVTFPWPIDRGLAERALTILTASGRPLAGEGTLEAGDVRWSFTPTDDWSAGDYRLSADPVLEDPSGNQIGRAFELDMKRQTTVQPNVERSIKFRVTHQ